MRKLSSLLHSFTEASYRIGVINAQMTQLRRRQRAILKQLADLREPV